MSLAEQKLRIDDLDITPEQKEELVRLPYRIGFWISQSDQTGGKESDDSELEALETIIISYGEDFCNSEFTHSVMKHTLAHYENWVKWEDNLTDVPEECKRSLYILSRQLEPKELDAFRNTLFEIAETVALAYREIAERETLATKIKIQVRIVQKKWDAFIKKYPFSLDHALNISPAEEQALGVLKGALRV